MDTARSISATAWRSGSAILNGSIDVGRTIVGAPRRSGQVMMFEGKATRHRYQRYDRANLQAHGAITAAAREKDAGKVPEPMLDHIIDAEKHVRRLRGALKRKLVLDSDARVRIALRREDA